MAAARYGHRTFGIRLLHADTLKRQASRHLIARFEGLPKVNNTKEKHFFRKRCKEFVFFELLCNTFLLGIEKSARSEEKN